MITQIFMSNFKSSSSIQGCKDTLNSIQYHLREMGFNVDVRHEVHTNHIISLVHQTKQIYECLGCTKTLQEGGPEQHGVFQEWTNVIQHTYEALFGDLPRVHPTFVHCNASLEEIDRRLRNYYQPLRC